MSSPPPHPYDLLTSMLNSLCNITIANHHQPADNSLYSHDYTDLSTTTSLSRLLGTADEKAARGPLLTLHFLYPHELLPALDLLDRRLVTRFVVGAGDEDKGVEIGGEPLPSISPVRRKIARGYEVFYVQSASAVTERGSKPGDSSRFRRAFNRSGMYYEVRLDAWNCTCPAFAYSAIGAMDGGTDEDHVHPLFDKHPPSGTNGESDWRFGGLLTTKERAAPVCKHILAVVIGSVAPNLFPEAIATSRVTPEALAGWAGGWGE